jgi:hypothetical protein
MPKMQHQDDTSTDNPPDPPETEVECRSFLTVDRWTGEQTGWFYGFHYVTEMPTDGKCPCCGVDLRSEPCR